LNTRIANIEDLDGLSMLFDAYRVFYKNESNLEKARVFLQERITNNESVIFVAEENFILTGFVQLYPLFSSTRLKRLWLLNDLFVDPSHRTKGISSALIEEAKKHCKETGACGLTLETDKTNLIGNNLYPKMGFELDISHNFYSWDLYNVKGIFNR
jgi:ribosomal protein S18 acetylase RimI-like enzyme